MDEFYTAVEGVEGAGMCTGGCCLLKADARGGAYVLVDFSQAPIYAAVYGGVSCSDGMELLSGGSEIGWYAGAWYGCTSTE